MKKIVILVILVLLLVAAAFYITSTQSNENRAEPTEDVVVIDPLKEVLVRARDIDFISYSAAIISESDESVMDFYQNKERVSVGKGVGEDRLVAYINTETEEYFGHFPELGVIVPLDTDYLLYIAQVSAIDLAEYLLREEAVVVDTEIIDGDNFLIVEHTDNKGRDMTFWIWEEYGIPISIEIYTGDEDFLMIDFYEINFNAISSDIFIIPATVDIS